MLLLPAAAFNFTYKIYIQQIILHTRYCIYIIPYRVKNCPYMCRQQTIFWWDMFQSHCHIFYTCTFYFHIITANFYMGNSSLCVLPNSCTSPIGGAFIYSRHMKWCAKIKRPWILNNLLDQNPMTPNGHMINKRWRDLWTFSTTPCRVRQFSPRSYNNYARSGEYTVPVLVVTVCLEICMMRMATKLFDSNTSLRNITNILIGTSLDDSNLYIWYPFHKIQ